MKPNILIVDDDASVLDILKKILSSNSCNTYTAQDSKSAMLCFEENHVDLVLIDHGLPDSDGTTTAKKMIQLKPRVPVIIITQHSSIANAVEAVKSGIYDYLEKPLDRERMLITIRNALSWGHTVQELDRYKDDSLAQYQMIGCSPAMQQIFAMVEKISATDFPVLILGPNGAGKELIAQAIHNSSGRAHRKMININCSAIPENLIESELFGHTKGAFSGAGTAKPGRIQMADKSTLFLDEIGDLSLAAQAKLLRFLEKGEIQKVGSTETAIVDTRIIAGTNQNLNEMIAKKEFREDLLYRIQVITINIPPLNERSEDIPLLLDHFMAATAHQLGINKPHLTPAAGTFLVKYAWPGNVRELKHFIERLLIMTDCDPIDLPQVKTNLLDQSETNKEIPFLLLKDARLNFEKEYIPRVIKHTNGNLAQAAAILGIDRGNLSRKMKQLGLN